MRSRWVWVVLASGVASLFACGGSSPDTDDPSSIMAGADGGDAALDGATSRGPGAGDGGADGAAVGSIAAKGEPIANPGTEAWTWVPFDGAKCLDGSSTGIGVSFGKNATQKTMIFLEGGGACFNAGTCGVGKSSYAESDFTQFSTTEGNEGIFDRTDSANALADWNFVYVPYCTGDIHAGNQPNGTVPGVTGTMQFVGYSNMAQYLTRVVPTFGTASQVLLTGSSAGGFGAAVNYDQVASAFGSIPVDLLDDSGPFMSNTYIAPCLETAWRTLWNLDSTFLAACGADCSDKTNYLIQYGAHIVKNHPQRKVGIVDSVGDIVIRQYFGWGDQNCTVTNANPLSADTYEAGLLDIRSELAAYPNYGGFYFDGIQHTSLIVGYDQRMAGSTSLTSWTGDLVSGTISNPGP